MRVASGEQCGPCQLMEIASLMLARHIGTLNKLSACGEITITKVSCPAFTGGAFFWRPGTCQFSRVFCSPLSEPTRLIGFSR